MVVGARDNLPSISLPQGYNTQCGVNPGKIIQFRSTWGKIFQICSCLILNCPQCVKNATKTLFLAKQYKV